MIKCTANYFSDLILPNHLHVFKKEINMDEKYQIIKMALRNGMLFSATFTKANGELRNMVCRTGVKKGIVPNADRQREAAPEPGNILRVWDMAKNWYRTVPLDRLISVKADGVVYNFS